MLEFMRKKRNSAILVGAFALIIVSFIFWVPAFQQGGSGDSTIIASVDGVKIPVSVYNAAYQRELNRLGSLKLPTEMLEKMKNSVLDRLIDRTVMLAQAKKEGVKVSSSDVQKTIMESPYFKKDGVFDKNLYFSVLESNRIKPEDYEDGLREDLIIEKMQERITGNVSVSAAEASEAYNAENRTVSFNYAVFDPKSYEASVEVKKEDAEKYLKAHGDTFMVPDRIKAVYAVFDKSDITNAVSVSEKEVRELYEAKKEDFKQPVRFRARHILAKFDPAASDKEKNKKETREKIDGILKKIKAGEEFAALAKEYSDDTGSAARGGDLDYFSLGMMVKPFEDAVIALKKGELSGVVETQYGYHIIKLEDKKDAEYKAFAEVRKNLEDELRRKKGSKLVEEKVSGLHSSFKSATSVDRLKAEIAKAGARAGETGFFTDTDKNVELAKDKKLADAAFVVGKGEVASVVDTGEKLYVIKVIDRIDRHVPPLNSVLGQVTKKIKEEKAEEIAKKKADDFVAALTPGVAFADAAKKAGVKTAKSAPTAFVSGTIKDIPLALTQDMLELFKLDKAAPHHKAALSSGGKFVVLSFADAKEADIKGFEDKKADIIKRLTFKKKGETFKKWLDDVKAKYDIKKNEQYL